MQQRYIVALVVILILVALGIAGFTVLNKNNVENTFSQEQLDLGTQESTPAEQFQNMDQNSSGTDSASEKVKKTYSQFPGILPDAQIRNKKAVIETDKGNIEFEIYPDSPKAASNFIFLANDSFYDGLTFHRVVPAFVIQGGDPKGDGTGGPGYQFEDEPVTKSYDKGIVAMANAGPNTNGSQFFIMLEDNPSLPPNYTVFGKVIKGQEVVSQIIVGDVIKKVTIQNLK